MSSSTNTHHHKSDGDKKNKKDKRRRKREEKELEKILTEDEYGDGDGDDMTTDDMSSSYSTSSVSQSRTATVTSKVEERKVHSSTSSQATTTVVEQSHNNIGSSSKTLGLDLSKKQSSKSSSSSSSKKTRKPKQREKDYGDYNDDDEREHRYHNSSSYHGNDDNDDNDMSGLSNREYRETARSSGGIHANISKANNSVPAEEELSIEAITANTTIIVNGQRRDQQGSSTTAVKKWFTMGRNTVRDISRWGKLYLAVAFIYTVAVIVQCTSGLVVNGMRTLPSYSNYYLNSLMIFITLLMLYFSFEAVIQENEFQLAGSLITGFLVGCRTVYTLVKVIIDMTKSKPSTSDILVNSFTIFVPTSTVLLCQVVMVLIVIPVFRSFGWKFYRMVGASPELIKFYRCYIIYVTMIKIDCLSLVSLFVSGLFFINFTWWYSYVGFAVGVVSSIIANPLSISLGVQREYHVIQILFTVFCLGLPGYLIFKIVDLWTDKAAIRQPADMAVDVVELKAILTTVISLSLFIRFLLIAWSIVVTINFRRGLYPLFQDHFWIGGKKGLLSRKRKHANNIQNDDDNMLDNPLLDAEL